jgi:hypothetical protein
VDESPLVYRAEVLSIIGALADLTSSYAQSGGFWRTHLAGKRKRIPKERIEEIRREAENHPTVLRLRELVAKGQAELRERGGPFR